MPVAKRKAKPACNGSPQEAQPEDTDSCNRGPVVAGKTTVVPEAEALGKAPPEKVDAFHQELAGQHAGLSQHYSCSGETT